MDVNDDPAALGDDQAVVDWVTDLVEDYFDEPAADDAAPSDDLLVDDVSSTADADGPAAPDLDPAELDPTDVDPADPGPADLDPADPADRGPTDLDPAVPEIVLDLEAPDPVADALPDLLDAPWPDPDATVAGLETLERAAELLGAPSLDELVEVAERLGVADELDLGLDGRTTAVVLGELGVDALVEHGSLDDLAARLDAGDEVLVTDADGRPATIVGLAPGRGEVEVVSHDGARHVVALDVVEERWAAGGYEMVVADGPRGVAAPGAPIRLAAAVTVLPVTLPPVGA
jgi:hypothetical protein